ncbi:MAG: lactate utilization protein [Acutalibacteraceae bacterium]
MTDNKPDIPRKIETAMSALARNHIDSCYVPTAAEVPAAVASLLHKGDVVSVGGSVTLQQTGVLDLLRNGDYRFLDRYEPGLSREQITDIYRQTFSADAYLCSCNAVTMHGELYNVDGNSNRIAAIAFGPKSVIMVVGKQKLVPDLDSAVDRVKTVAAPLNAKRLDCDTYCAQAGRCAGAGGGMTLGCGQQDRICSNYLICAKQKHKGRIKVIFVGEEVGY